MNIYKIPESCRYFKLIMKVNFFSILQYIFPIFVRVNKIFTFKFLLNKKGYKKEFQCGEIENALGRV